MESFLKGLRVTLLGINLLVALALVALAAGALLALASEMYHVVISGAMLTPLEFTQLINTILEVFILVELFRIAIAYMRHENVVPTVLEAALVAVARKFVVFEGSGDYFMTALGLAALLIAVAVAWFLLQRSNACELAE